MSKDKYVNVTITRTSRDLISIRLRDSASRIEFVDVTMSLDDFARAVTGLSEISAKAELRGLEHVGKTKQIEQRRVECPIKSYSRDVLQNWLEENCQEEGWIINSYLGSQNSISYKDDKTIINYSVYRYID
jgi:hypothetical protein